MQGQVVPPRDFAAGDPLFALRPPFGHLLGTTGIAFDRVAIGQDGFLQPLPTGPPKRAIVDGAGKQLKTNAGIARTTNFSARPVSFSRCRPAGRNRMASAVRDPLATVNGRPSLSSVTATSPAKAKKHQPWRADEGDFPAPSSPRWPASINSLTRLLRTTIRHGSASEEPAFSLPMALAGANTKSIVATKNNRFVLDMRRPPAGVLRGEPG